MFFYYFTKRFLDILVSLIGLVVLLPLIVVIMILIKIDSPGPIFFVQHRVGYRGRLFKFYKFRSMVDRAYLMGPLVNKKGDERVTKIGKFLRKCRFDEILQLFNILKGDMSFVGPRPEVKKYVNFYNDEQRKILEIKPGAFCLSTLSHLDEQKFLADFSPDEVEQQYINKIMPAKLSLDLEYAQRPSLLKDLAITLKLILGLLHS